MIVVDASAMVTALADDGPDGVRARARLRDSRMAAPHLIDLEVVSALRSHTRRGQIDERRAERALATFGTVPLKRISHAALLSGCWERRDDLTPYDAIYVTIAALLDAPLITFDARLAAAPGLRCEVEVL